jgi:hypothetical protein
MAALDSPIAAVGPYAVAAFSLAGSLIGGFIAGTGSLLVARQAREAAEQAWVRDNRRVIYDRFLTAAQKLLIACEACKHVHRKGGDNDSEDSKGTEDAVQLAHNNFFESYVVVQTVADTRLVDAARVYAYRLWELRESLRSKSVLGPENFDRVAELVRDARHDTINGMRTELGLAGNIRPPDDYNPFAGIDNLGEKYAAADRDRPGAAPAS